MQPQAQLAVDLGQVREVALWTVRLVRPDLTDRRVPWTISDDAWTTGRPPTATTSSATRRNAQDVDAGAVADADGRHGGTGDLQAVHLPAMRRGPVVLRLTTSPARSARCAVTAPR